MRRTVRTPAKQDVRRESGDRKITRMLCAAQRASVIRADVYTRRIYMLAEIKRWGNSWAIRITRSDLQRLGLREGDRVEVTVKRLAAKGKVDLSGFPFIDDPDPVPLEQARREYYTAPRRWELEDR